MTFDLSRGAIAAISETEGAASINPILQVADLRLVNTQNQKTERYRVLLSDGMHLQQGMLATQNNELVRSNTLRKGSIVELGQCMCNTVQGRKIIIIIELKVLLEECGVIGDPKQYNPSSAPAARPSPQVQSTVDQPTAPSNFAPPHAGNNLGSPVARPNVPVGTIPNQPKIDRSSGSQAHGGYVASNANAGHFGATNAYAMHSRTEIGAGNQHASFNSNGRPSTASHQQQPSPMHMNRGPVSRNAALPRIIPICALNPYNPGWTIKARVTSKGVMRTYKNARGEGKVFSFDLLDAGGGEIRATCFNLVAEQFYDLIEVGRVYIISRGSVKNANKSFNHLNSDVEITLDNSSTVELCPDDDNSIPSQQFHFRQISEVESMDANKIVDLIGVVSSVSPTTSIMTKKDNREIQKRAIELRDMSERSVELTVWGDFCNKEGLEIQQRCDSGDFPVLAVKACRVADFNGKRVGTLSSSQLLINPDFQEAFQLKAWFESVGRSAECPSISKSNDFSDAGGKMDVRKTISQIKDENLGTKEKPDWVAVSATITFIKTDNFYYPACPAVNGDRQCNKKVTDQGDGTWTCAKCDQNFDKCDFRYILQLQIQDHTGTTWVTAFQEPGTEIMGMSAEDLCKIKSDEQGDALDFEEVWSKALFRKYLFKLRVKEELYNDEQRLKSTVVKVEKLDYVSEARFRLNALGMGVAEAVGLHPPSSGNAFVNSGVSGSYGGVGSTGLGVGQPASQVGQYGGSRYTGGVASNSAGVGQPASQVGQQVNQYGGSRYTASGTTGSVVRCSSCNGSGHDASSCPSFMNGQEQSYGGGYSNVSNVPPAYGSGNATSGSYGGGGGGASGECFKCHQSGHWSRDCPNASNVPPAYGSGNAASGSYGGGGGGGASGECFKCHQSGHWSRDCPNASNVPPAYGSGNATSGSYGGGGASGECFKCHQSGHWSRDCPNNVSSGRSGGYSNQRVGRT